MELGELLVGQRRPDVEVPLPTRSNWFDVQSEVLLRTDSAGGDGRNVCCTSAHPRYPTEHQAVEFGGSTPFGGEPLECRRQALSPSPGTKKSSLATRHAARPPLGLAASPHLVAFRNCLRRWNAKEISQHRLSQMVGKGAAQVRRTSQNGSSPASSTRYRTVLSESLRAP